MELKMRAIRLLFVLLVSFFCGSRLEITTAAAIRQETESTVGVPWIQTETVSKIEIPSVPDAPLLTLPLQCSGDKIFVRMASANGGRVSLSDLVSISSDGQSVTRFPAQRINDIANPNITKFFVADSDVYMLVLGSIPQNKMITLRKPTGEVEQQSAVVTKTFIARFKRNGSYAGAVTLDLPFDVHQMGVFPSGDFLIAGQMKELPDPMPRARAALVSSSGQFRRLIELKGDIQLRPASEESQNHGSDENTGPPKLPLVGERYGEGFSDVILASNIVQDGRNLLLVRKGSKPIIFSISPGGEVRTVTPQLPAGFSLDDLKTTPLGRWIALLKRFVSKTEGEELLAVVLDPLTGTVLTRYRFSRSLGFGLACVSDNQFSFLTRGNGKLSVTTVVAESSPAAQNSSGSETAQKPK